MSFIFSGTMRYLIITILLFTGLQVFSQLSVTVNWVPQNNPSNHDTIYYNYNKKLNWTDFKGKPDGRSDATAITSSGFGYTAGIKYANTKTDIEINVFCFFSRLHSWVKKGLESDYALNHEQHHFDITYIAADLFVKKLKAASFTRNNYDEMLDKIYRESSQLLEKMQNDYDGQTRNGRLKNVQESWNKKIDNQLALLTKD